MRPLNTNSVSYQPGNVPDDPAQLPRYLRELEMRLTAAIAALAAGHLDRIYVVPAKPRDGDVRYLDGSIAPGGARGIYFYDDPSSTWKLLG
jgi:hypothetical protein